MCDLESLLASCHAGAPLHNDAGANHHGWQWGPPARGYRAVQRFSSYIYILDSHAGYTSIMCRALRMHTLIREGH